MVSDPSDVQKLKIEIILSFGEDMGNRPSHSFYWHYG